MGSPPFKPGDTVRSFGEGMTMSADGDDSDLFGVVLRVRTPLQAGDNDYWIGVKWSKQLKHPSALSSEPDDIAIKPFTRWHYPKYLLLTNGFHLQVMTYIEKELRS